TRSRGRPVVSRRRGSGDRARRLVGSATAHAGTPARRREPLMAAAKLMDFDKALELFEPVLGFEVHVELNTNTKMFSDAPNPANEKYHAAEPNTLIAAVDLGLPGALPVVNATAIESSISLGLALNCSIAASSRF